MLYQPNQTYLVLCTIDSTSTVVQYTGYHAISTKPNLASSKYTLQYLVYTGYHASSTKPNLFSSMYCLQYVVYTGYNVISTKPNIFSCIYNLRNCTVVLLNFETRWKVNKQLSKEDRG